MADLDYRNPRYDRWVAATTRWLDLLAWVFLGDFFLGWLFPSGPQWWRGTETSISWIVWGAFATDYIVRLCIASHRWTFVKRNKLGLLMVLLPMLRIIRVLLLLRKSLSNISTEKIASSLMLVILGFYALGSLVEWRFEHNAEGANIKTIGDAFWWGITTQTTVGYGDTYPITSKGRITAAVVMLVGIGLIGIVSASVASWFVKRTGKDQSEATEAALESAQEDVTQLTTQIQQLRDEQAELKSLIQQLVQTPRTTE